MSNDHYNRIVEAFYIGWSAGEFLKFVEDEIRHNYLVFADYYGIDPKFYRSEFEIEVMRQNCNILDYLRKNLNN